VVVQYHGSASSTAILRKPEKLCSSTTVLVLVQYYLLRVVRLVIRKKCADLNLA
jgi:hypothetical protein